MNMSINVLVHSACRLFVRLPITEADILHFLSRNGFSRYNSITLTKLNEIKSHQEITWSPTKRQLLVGTRPLRICVDQRTDGFGAQAHGILRLFAWCELIGADYVHTPFTKIGFTAAGKHVHLASPETSKANVFMGFSPDPPKTKPDLVVHVPKGWENVPGRLFTKETREKVRQLYDKTPKPMSQTKNDIALHIRRGDVNATSNAERFTPNTTYVKMVHHLQKTHPGAIVHVYSVGKMEDFGELGKQKNVIFHLNDEVLETFHNLVTAKVLIVAKSSFSFAAGLLNFGEVWVVHPFMIGNVYPLPHWSIFNVQK